MKKLTSIVVALLLIAGYWVLENVDLDKLRERVGGGGVQTPASTSQAGAYERLDGCVLVEHRNNDGDSFHVRHGKDQYEFRLHFVDTPESKVKHYRNGDNNLERLGHQGRYFGSLSVEQTTTVGTEAKEFTLGILKGRPFTVYTQRKLVYPDDTRLYAFVEVTDSAGRARLLGELLVEQGLARIYTRGADLPDGTRERDQDRKLESLERSAKGGRLGGWRFAGR